MSSPLVRSRLSGGLLRQLLEDPELAPALRALPAPALRQVILQVGLEDAGELVALSSPGQLREVFDEDLWRSARAGEDAVFDAERLVVWLEVMLEGGEAFVADRLADLSGDFLVYAVSQLVRVLDVAVLTVWARDPEDAQRLDELVDDQLCQELDEFLLVSRTERGWDAVLASLLALDERHPERLHRVLARCAAATHDEVQSTEELEAVLRGDEVLQEDARTERDERRAERGYVSPADARAFLALARSAPERPGEDPITRAHFRERRPEALADPAPVPDAPRREAPPLRRLLARAGVPAATPASASQAVPEAGSLFRRTLAELYEHDPGAHQRALEELAYLANVLVAGDTRAWQPLEAAERVLELCDLGLGRAAREAPGPDAARQALRTWGAVGLFRLAWATGAPGPDDPAG